VPFFSIFTQNIMQKPGIPEGTRDFGPEQVRKRTYIFDTIRTVFTQYGFQPLETPSMENLSTLTGKYGEEGDKLLFKILNNGDFLKDADAVALHEKDSAAVLPVVAKRGLRYDLTVPFARYVAMNRGQLTFPFKRYQIQPVWRADRPQRGRYREFYQCDADVIGSDSLLLEAELVQIYDRAFAQLGVPVTIKVNHRKILLGIAEAAGIPDQFMDMTVAVDKLDKIGIDGVKNELQQRGIGEAAIAVIEQALAADGLEQLRPLLANSTSGQEGLAELERVLGFLSTSNLHNALTTDVTLARGLTYYTGCIFEVSANGVQMGSIGGGGRYADLTGVFGVPGLSGVGISFGADRIYDVMEQLNLFPESLSVSVQVLIASFDDATLQYAFQCAARMRQAGIATEVYPEAGKLKKQFEYAAKRNMPFVAIAGEAEMQQQTLTIKNQSDGTQETLSLADCIARWAK
jgi:histidyl-tRNA synthetase